MDTPRPDRRVAALIALKPLPTAKTRLSDLPSALRMRLAQCMALDTIAALSTVVDEVLVITDQPDFAATMDRHRIVATVIGEPSADEYSAYSAQHGTGGEASLNIALGHGDRLLRTAGARTVLACVGDLPALRTSTVRRILTIADELAAQEWSRAYLPDHSGRGTTMLIAHDVPLDPRYGRENATASAERHRLSGAAPLATTGVDDARWDVDTLTDLRTAADLGVGPATAALLDPANGALGRRLQLSS